MKISITGGNGFIGSRFLSVYSDRFSSVNKLVSSKVENKNDNLYSLDDYESISSACVSVDAFIHCAFDHTYKNNLIGIKNILKACRMNKVKRFVYLSTVSVYDPLVKGVLNEAGVYSKLNDPYSLEKRKIENIIKGYSHEYPSLEVVILQPSIVYGVGGAWSQYAFNVCCGERLVIPAAGRYICNAVYVDDVALSIFISVTKELPSEVNRYLVTGFQDMLWSDFYALHLQVLLTQNSKLGPTEFIESTKYHFHESGLVNGVFNLWFKTLVGRVFNMFIGGVKNVRARKYKKLQNVMQLKELAILGECKSSFSPLGITRLVHRSEFIVDASKLESELLYRPRFTSDLSVKDMIRILSA